MKSETERLSEATKLIEKAFIKAHEPLASELYAFIQSEHKIFMDKKNLSFPPADISEVKIYELKDKPRENGKLLGTMEQAFKAEG